jgi:hypothetical protein
VEQGPGPLILERCPGRAPYPFRCTKTLPGSTKIPSPLHRPHALLLNSAWSRPHSCSTASVLSLPLVLRSLGSHWVLSCCNEVDLRSPSQLNNPPASQQEDSSVAFLSSPTTSTSLLQASIVHLSLQLIDCPSRHSQQWPPQPPALRLLS